jgi:hypothetical protein
MAAHFQPRLDAYDLQHLGSYTIACRVLHDGRELPAATATTLPPSKPTPGDTAGSIRARARSHATERSVVEATIRDRYGRIEQPPPGRAQADEPAEEFRVQWLEGAPFGAPHDAPSEGAPLAPEIPHQHKDLEDWRDPDIQDEFLDRGRRP